MSSERDIVAARWELARLHPRYFCRWFCYTLDQQDEVTPHKSFPWCPHIEYLTRLWFGNRMLFVAKSRQMKVTWWAAMLSVWVPLFHEGRLVYQQSKRLDQPNCRCYTTRLQQHLQVLS